MLSVLDGLWKDHLCQMDHLEEGIFMRNSTGRTLVAYRKSPSRDVRGRVLRFQEDTVRHLFRMQIVGLTETN